MQRRERRAREREERARIDEAFNHDVRWAAQSSGAPSSTTVPDRLTTLGLPHSDPISAGLAKNPLLLKKPNPPGFFHKKPEKPHP